MKDMKYGGKGRHHHDFDPRHEGFGPRGRRPGFGPGGFGPGGFGPEFGPGRGPRGGRERGDVRTAVLVLLAEQPRHGYDLMRAIEERTEGAWSPSPGSIYPTLQALEDEGLIAFETVDGRKTASLSDAGQKFVAEHTKEAEAVFTRDSGRPAELVALRSEMHGLHEAAMLIARRRDAELAKRAAHLLESTRKELYRLLADD